MDEVKWMMAKEIPQLRRYAFILTGDIHAADDLVQDCLERAIRKRHLWKRHGSIRSWLYRILYNVFLNSRSRWNRSRSHIALDDVPSSLAEPARQEHGIACREISEALRRLPPEQSAAIALTAIQGFSYDEASKILGVPVGTVRSRLFRGRETLRALFDTSGTILEQDNCIQFSRVRRK